MLKRLQLIETGPLASLNMEPSRRLNLIAGDNGLGKTFLLDTAWWALSQTWAGAPAMPHNGKAAQINLGIELAESKYLQNKSFGFDQGRWSVLDNQTGHSNEDTGIIIYARVDGSFSIRDPIRNDWPNVYGMIGQLGVKKHPVTPLQMRSYQFTQQSLWEGLQIDELMICNGLLNDWIKWQYQPKQSERSPFAILQAVLKILSPDAHEQIGIGEPVRLSPYDARDYPTIELPYGSVPVTQASAGMKRILSLAYVLVWAWYEHLQACQLLQRAPSQQMILLIDEVEAHLHPRWQRSLLPALLKVVQLLDPQMQVQILASTHAPLVMASVEPLFDPEQDSLFLFQQQGQQICFEEVPWAKQGDATNWLVSEVFGLEQARSVEAEQAIEAAEAWMRRDTGALPNHLQDPNAIHAELLRVLAGHDPFWPRWVIHRDQANRQEPEA